MAMIFLLKHASHDHLSPTHFSHLHNVMPLSHFTHTSPYRLRLVRLAENPSTQAISKIVSECPPELRVTSFEGKNLGEAPNRLKAKYDSYETAQSSLLKLVEKAPVAAPTQKRRRSRRKRKTSKLTLPSTPLLPHLTLAEGKKIAAAIHTQKPVTALRSTLEWPEMLLKFASDDTEAALSLETDLFADLQTLFKQTNARRGDPVQVNPYDHVTRLCCAIIHDLCDGNALAVDIIDNLIAANLHLTLITTIAKTGAAVTSSMLETFHSFSFGRASQMKTLIDAGVVDVLVDALDAKDRNAADTACATLSAFVALSGEDATIFRVKKRDDKVDLVQQPAAPVPGARGEGTRAHPPWFTRRGPARPEGVRVCERQTRHMCPPLGFCLAMMYNGSELPLTYQAINLFLHPIALAIPHTPHEGNARYALVVLAEGKGEENLKKSIVSATYAASLPSLILANEPLRTLSNDTKLAIAGEGSLGRMYQYLSQLLKTKSLDINTKTVKATMPPLETKRTWVCLVMSVAHKVLVDCNHSTEELFCSNLLIRTATPTSPNPYLFETCTECELDEELETLADLGAVKAATPFLPHFSPDVSINCAFVISRIVAGQWRLLHDSCAVGCEHEHEPASHPCFAEMETTKLDDTLFALFERLIGDRKRQERCRHKRRHPRHRKRDRTRSRWTETPFQATSRPSTTYRHIRRCDSGNVTGWH
ncbi:hypothetical protein BLNAU_21548 [Blattamonas nauphoetae]|uniref:Uncharacterized protein n=1 Tax=Blattamonas nauphoetae TaxID=2049346 RepID=A0ABQ9WVK4_9EUKA|nr:hypothetical protein BLNAU_21548 [Blattamonas nauphoetae]